MLAQKVQKRQPFPKTDPTSLDNSAVVDDGLQSKGTTSQFDPASLINEFNKQPEYPEKPAPQASSSSSSHKVKFMDNITRRKEEKAAGRQGFTKSDQISYIGQINNNNNNINNFFISDASSLLQPAA